MDRKSSNHEQESAARTAELLERRPLSPTHQQQSTHELGQLLREASETDLPPSNESLRATLVEALAQDTASSVSLKSNNSDPSISHRTNPRRFWFVTAASGLLLLTGAVAYSLNSFSGERSPMASAPVLIDPAKDNLELLRDETHKLKADLAVDKASKAASLAKLQSALLQSSKGDADHESLDAAKNNAKPVAVAGLTQDQKLEAIRSSNTNLGGDLGAEVRENRVEEEAITPKLDSEYEQLGKEKGDNFGLKSSGGRGTSQQGDGKAGPSEPGLGRPAAKNKSKSQSGNQQGEGAVAATESRSNTLAQLNKNLGDAKNELAVKSVELQERLNRTKSLQPEFNIPSQAKAGQSGDGQWFDDRAGEGKDMDFGSGGLGGIAENSDAGGMAGRQSDFKGMNGDGGGLGGGGFGGGGLGGGGGGLGRRKGEGKIPYSTHDRLFVGGIETNHGKQTPLVKQKGKLSTAFGDQVVVGGGSGVVGRIPTDSNSLSLYSELEELEIERDRLTVTEKPGPGHIRFRALNQSIEERKRQLDRWERPAELITGGEVAQSGEQYLPIHENPFVPAAGADAISTFSIDVDTASYANMRRFLNSGQRPPRNSVRIEELVNYFNYDYAQPTGEHPFSVNTELADCPWKTGHKLLRVGLKGKDIHVQERPATNVVFLIDVSGSMKSGDKLPLLKSGFQMLARQLGENDRVSIVTYAGQAGVALEPTNGSQTQTIENAIEKLTPGGSTHGSAGIELAYQLAQKNFVHEGVNKVILATDGDLNVGVTGNNALVNLIKEKAAEGVFLTVLGFGTGNLKDGKLEQLADNGNGMYSYIDSTREAHRVLVDQLSGSLVTIAKDVKIQIEFNPAEVKSYRLLGYENRMLATQDFDDDSKDAGEIGAGHTVTAIYQIEPVSQSEANNSIPAGLKYQVNTKDKTATPAPSDESGLSEAALSGEMATVALRYKQPDANESKRLEVAVKNEAKSFSAASSDFRFAASVAGFGMLLRGSKHRGTINTESLLQAASRSIGNDPAGYRAEFIDLIRKFQSAR